LDILGRTDLNTHQLNILATVSLKKGVRLLLDMTHNTPPPGWRVHPTSMGILCTVEDLMTGGQHIGTVTGAKAVRTILVLHHFKAVPHSLTMASCTDLGLVPHIKACMLHYHLNPLDHHRRPLSTFALLTTIPFLRLQYRDLHTKYLLLITHHHPSPHTFLRHLAHMDTHIRHHINTPTHHYPAPTKCLPRHHQMSLHTHPDRHSRSTNTAVNLFSLRAWRPHHTQAQH
jgi:hypothetical protein